MKEQLIVTIGREFGSGGHYIASQLSEKLSIPLLDKQLIEDIVAAYGIDKNEFFKYDGKPANKIASRRIGNYSNSLEEYTAHRVFDFIKKEAEMGASFVVVGRCGGYVLRDNDNCIRFFIIGDKEDKIARVMKKYGVSEKKALEMIKSNDKKRKVYHNYYTDTKWGTTDGYDFVINSSKLGLDATAEAIRNIVEQFRNG